MRRGPGEDPWVGLVRWRALRHAAGRGRRSGMLSYPAGRVRDVYLAMMTLGFGMVFYEVVREWNGLSRVA